MTDRLFLSKPHQEEIAEMAARDARKSRGVVKTALKWLGGITLGTVAAVALLPAAPALIAGVIGATGLAVAGGIAGSHYKNAKALDRVEKEVGAEDFVARLQQKSERLSRFHKSSEKVSNIGLWSNIGLMAVGFVFPPAAVVTEPLRHIAILGWGGGGLGSLLTRAEERSFKSLNTTVSTWAPRDTQVVTAETAVLSLKQSISPGFGLAANANTADAAGPAVQDDKPAAKRAPKL
ncbi:MAG TPA: hypothetical protein VEF76_00745 [Patescibacteria group bacterium]|nr:hypothetical protein [Patescibacteria group bacterium]